MLVFFSYFLLYQKITLIYTPPKKNFTRELVALVSLPPEGWRFWQGGAAKPPRLK